MDFEWKQRIIFTFVLATPFFLSASSSSLSSGVTTQSGIYSSKNPVVKQFREFKDDKNDQLPICEPLQLVKDIPARFDARREWPKCTSLWEIRDQGHCNSWAFALASVLTDRNCIGSQDTSSQWRASDQDLLDCASENRESVESPCSYQPLTPVWKYVQEKGVLSGGWYNSNMGCRPSALKVTCKHINSGNNSCKNAPPPSIESFKCKEGNIKCDNSFYSRTYVEDRERHQFKPCRLARNNIRDIQAEIMTHGPVLAVMHLYDDLYKFNHTFGSGVYQNEKEAEDPHQSHPVKIVGWDSTGTGDAFPEYWIVVNTFGYQWGDGGFFKVRMSQDRPKLGAWITETVSTSTVELTEIKSLPSYLLQNFLQLFKYNHYYSKSSVIYVTRTI